MAWDRGALLGTFRISLTSIAMACKSEHAPGPTANAQTAGDEPKQMPMAESVLTASAIPIAIFHAFNQPFGEIEDFVCSLADQGYSHLQISPAQKSLNNGKWWGRYQPVDFAVIDGLGDEAQLRTLTSKAHDCNVRVIADVVFNHMTNQPPAYDATANTFNFNGLSAGDFRPKCDHDIRWDDGNRNDEIFCWLNGDLPDLKQENASVQNVQNNHLTKLLDLGIDGFRFDAAKHMSNDALQMYVNEINAASGGRAWNYLEVIEDSDTQGEDYNQIAAVTDFRLYNSLKAAFSFGGDLRSLRVPNAMDDARSVVFGINHDTDPAIHDQPLNAYADREDAVLASAFVLAHEAGVPLVLNSDNLKYPFLRAGVKFRQIMRQRKDAGGQVKENVLAVVDSDRTLVVERGAEGFFVVNKGAERFDTSALDMTLTNLEGCYRELRQNFLVAVERRPDNKKYITRWGTPTRGGMEVHARDALYFIREPWQQCASR